MGGLRDRWTDCDQQGRFSTVKALLLKLRTALSPGTFRRAGRSKSRDTEVAAAWLELREHPALRWVPPMWRSGSPSAALDRHTLSAVEKNLMVEIVNDSGRAIRVRLATGPLVDRHVGDGVDPLTPAISVHPELTACAPTFEQAIIQLRDAVVHVYGPSDVSDPLRRSPERHAHQPHHQLRSAH
jgi:hypothetical protein